VGYGLSGDAYHITAPSRTAGAMRAMTAALKRAQVRYDKIDYINAHGTSTMADVIELGAVRRPWPGRLQALHVVDQVGDRPSVGSGRPIEAIYSIKSINEQAVPPTLNLDEPDEGWRHRPGGQAGKQRKVRYCSATHSASAYQRCVDLRRRLSREAEVCQLFRWSVLRAAVRHLMAAALFLGHQILMSPGPWPRPSTS